MIKFCIYYYSKKIRKDKIRTNYDHEDFKIFLLKPMSDPRGTVEVSKATPTSPALVVSRWLEYFYQVVEIDKAL